MPDVRYVILSDLHFGADNSLLTAVEPGPWTADPTRAPATLDALVACLATLAAANESGAPPTLVLAGDVLELALAPDHVAAGCFERFVEALSAADLLRHELWFVPGNHDHHLWETARERQYADHVRSLPADQPLPPPWHSTRMFPSADDPTLEAELLAAVLRRGCGRDDVRVRMAYPNLGLAADDRSRVVVVHHGHFVESVYILMSALNTMLFNQPMPEAVWEWEGENFAWIDFLWSALGRSGEVGQHVGLLYDMLQSEVAVRELVLAIAEAVRIRTPGSPPRRWVVERAVRHVLGRVATRAGVVERRVPATTLSANAEQGLSQYLTGPLRHQLRTETRGDPLPATTFVFGHTHKPFETRRAVDGWTGGLDIANTGGWVVDAMTTERHQGAAAVVVDESLRVASIRLYQQASSPDDYRVRVTGVTADAAPFVARLGEVVDPDAGPWRAMSAAAAAGVVERQRALADVLARSRFR